MGDARQSPESPAPELAGAVIAAVIPDQTPRVVQQAAEQARLRGAPLVVAHVDVTRFVTYEDPDGMPHTAPIDINVDAGAEELKVVERQVAEALEGTGAAWTTTQLVGDPALALKHYAEKVDASLIVLGTRKRGFGETLREFFTGSVAARLSHRQHRPLLVVPVDEPVGDEQDPFPDD